jgi:hypothetical protein
MDDRLDRQQTPSVPAVDARFSVATCRVKDRPAGPFIPVPIQVQDNDTPVSDRATTPSATAVAHSVGWSTPAYNTRRSKIKCGKRFSHHPKPYVVHRLETTCGLVGRVAGIRVGPGCQEYVAGLLPKAPQIRLCRPGIAHLGRWHGYIDLADRIKRKIVLQASCSCVEPGIGPFQAAIGKLSSVVNFALPPVVIAIIECISGPSQLVIEPGFSADWYNPGHTITHSEEGLGRDSAPLWNSSKRQQQTGADTIIGSDQDQPPGRQSDWRRLHR